MENLNRSLKLYPTQGTRMSFFVSCAKGLEQILCQELMDIFDDHGVIAEVFPSGSGCLVSGPWDCCVLVNLHSFCAVKIFLNFAQGILKSETSIYENVLSLPWETIFTLDKTFAVEASLYSSFIQNSMYLALKIKDAICDRFRQKTGSRPSVDTKNPQVNVFARLFENNFIISIDLTGIPLFKRGYRTQSAEAPLKENLAAALLRLTGWSSVARGISSSKEPIFFQRVFLSDDEQNVQRKIPSKILLSPFLCDQFCGSGTLAIEAALLLMNFNPNTNRNEFGFCHVLPDEQSVLKNLFIHYKQKLLAQKISDEDVKINILNYCSFNNIHIEDIENFIPIHASDISEKSVKLASESAALVGVSGLIHFQEKNMSLSRPHASVGLILNNPPYGERLGDVNSLSSLYREMGNTWKHYFSNWSAWILSYEETLTKSVGLRSTRTVKVFNGNLECRFLQYVLYGR